ncbi:HECT-domain-containing protein [Pluteus cervinus]|uniref:HECT-domain-containing protein n=1 Tax=Pluteus cervinus TaxID=181527 RepID=A0ACD3AXU2_9AGAR|nr:HECT-domain-containing protein [Pluteus cervinus]
MFSFESERRRKINLGGVSSAATSTEVLGQAKAIRLERLEQKRRQENATRLQAWWRGVNEARRTRDEMRRTFEGDVSGLTGLRCLVLIGQDEGILGRWSSTLSKYDETSLFMPAKGSHKSSWVVLIRKTCLLLLRSVAESPHGPNASNHLRILNALLSPEVAKKHLGPGTDFTQSLIQYLLGHEYYSLIARSISAIPLEDKASSSSLPTLVQLVVYPLKTFPSTSSQYSEAILSLFFSIFTIPLVPNRLPIPSLTHLSANLPLKDLHLLEPSLSRFSTLGSDARAHLLANVLMFVPPRYSALPDSCLSAYLRLLTTLFEGLPAHALQPSDQINQTNIWTQIADMDEDDLPNQTRVRVVSNFELASPLPRPQLDTRTYKRLAVLPTLTHIKALLAVAQKRSFLAFVTFILSLNKIWPMSKDHTLSAILINSKNGIVKELYRGYVRGTKLGKDEYPDALTEFANASAWPPILLLCDLYTQALRTMDDDEFFGKLQSTSAPRNPLTLDEVSALSRRLINIAFPLYWNEEQFVQVKGMIPHLQYSWDLVRDSMTKCVLAIHARDSRKPFVPPTHWHVGSQLDMRAFIEAAIFEEQQITNNHQTTLPSNSRLLSTISPCLNILNNIPFAIPFDSRIYIYRSFIHSDMFANGREDSFLWRRTHRNNIQVRRGHVAQDGFDKLGNSNLKGPIEISFIDQFGQAEAGIDGGGVFKEFFTSLCKEVFDTDRGLWLANQKNELYPNPHAYATESYSLSWYRFIGRIVGKAMYEGILIDVAFAGFFLSKWLRRESLLDDLASLDPDLYKGLIYLKHYPGNPEDLSLSFTVADEEFGVTKTIDLKPNGSNIPVTRENRHEYILLMSHYRLSKQIRKQSDAFFEGLSEMIDQRWVRMFNQQELQLVLGGTDAPIDLDDLRKHTNYGGVYDDNEETIVKFWKVVNTFNHEQRRSLLRFVTSCSRPPLLGFKELVPNFSIRDSGDEQRLPSSSTCVNLLKLPRYKSGHILRDKLLKAINSGAGFDLS